MRLLLKNFSQDVDFLNPEVSANYLVFVDEHSGETLRLQVPMETVLELTRWANERTKFPTPTPEPEEPLGADEFGGDVEAPIEDDPDGEEGQELGNDGVPSV